MTLTISYVVPVHNNAATIESVVRRLIARLEDHPGSEVALIENGSTDTSATEVQRVAGSLSSERVTVLSGRSGKGLGCAWREGIAVTTGDLVVLTASDLPFGFSDLEQALRLTPVPRLVIGSKAHPASEVHVNIVRRLTSRGFRLFRGLLLGLWQGDTQGTLLGDGRLLRGLLSTLTCDDYLIGTEIVARALHAGVRPVEVAVDYPRAPHHSTVSPVAALRMLVGLMQLRRRLPHALPVPAPHKRGA